MNYLSSQQVLFINARLIAETGGKAGLRDVTMLESAVARPHATFDGKELYPGLFEKAAALFDLLVNNHAFIDGNKRTGITSTAMFLRINGFRLSCTQNELEVFTLQVATIHPPVAELAGWLKEHSLAV
jgi:death-on-curing protein